MTSTGDSSFAGPFSSLAGNWAGNGTLTMSGTRERIRCRAIYFVSSGGESLQQILRCASDNFIIDVHSNVIEIDGRLSGTWQETSSGRERLFERDRARGHHPRLDLGARRYGVAFIDHARAVRNMLQSALAVPRQPPSSLISIGYRNGFARIDGNVMQRLSLTARCYFFAICLSLAFCVPAKADPDALHAFLESLWPRASAQGISRATFVRALDDLSEDPSVPIAVAKQPEFERLLSAYFKEAVLPTRIARGRALAETYHRQLDTVVRRYGVPRGILLAAWGMESDFGRDRGDKDVIRSLATLAFHRRDNDLFANELLSALVILQRGQLTRARLVGSWAGAMGDPQFMPSAYLKYAVSLSRHEHGRHLERSSRHARLDRPFSARVRLEPGFALGRGGRAAEDFRLQDIARGFSRFRRGRCEGCERRTVAARQCDLIPACRRWRPGVSAQRQLLGSESLQQFGLLRFVARLPGRSHRRAERSSQGVAATSKTLATIGED
ncbi:MAG: lytic murein transglycosylase [Methylovirgula sp.]